MAEDDAARCRALADHLRDPEATSPPEGMDPAALRLYRALVLGNLANLLGDVFPALAGTLGERPFREWVARFLARHRCATPYFHRLGGEFAHFLAAQADAGEAPTWLAELADFEWQKWQLEFAAGEAGGPLPEADRLLEHSWRLGPLARLCRYRHPVHELPGGGAPPTGPSPRAVSLLVFRDREARVRCFELNPGAALLLEALAATGKPARELLAPLAEALHLAPAAAERAAAELLCRLAQWGVAEPRTPFV
ncbi:MAG: hypothetical protein KatS3mg124_1279 [Porticoccaceae bacterium]|nr:MAG: hypothetical protein KatS3mg124_1279 [Porticoccaceae bacterium]